MGSELAEGGFCWLDGDFHREIKTPVNAGLLHSGLLIREGIRTLGTRLAFFREHYNQLESRLKSLGINLDSILTPEEMHRQAVNLINKNRYFGGNLLQVSIIQEYRADRGDSHCLMQCSTLDQTSYVLNRKGYVLGLYDDLNIPLERLTGLIDRSPLIDYFARLFVKAGGLDDCILFNRKGHVAGSLESTVFFRIRDRLHTPPLKDGVMPSVMRDQVMDLLAAAGDPVNDEISLRPVDIEEAEEIFLANASEGIRWVVSVDRVRYFNHTGTRLINMLNDKAFGMLS
jgi:branched-subunit amino acid aminotransferase/4-amino-4-deoxychorismate lyase